LALGELRRPSLAVGSTTKGWWRWRLILVVVVWALAPHIWTDRIPCDATHPRICIVQGVLKGVHLHLQIEDLALEV